MCDGDSDCEDNSDEENCESLACRPPSHPCANNTSVCLPPDKLCDGNDDCGDGSDEGELCGESWAQERQMGIRAMGMKEMVFKTLWRSWIDGTNWKRNWENGED